MKARSAVAPALLVMLIACDGQRDIAPDGVADTVAPAPAWPAADSASAPGGDVPTRAASIEDTVMIEGMPQIERSTLVSAPAGFAVPFSTYLPQGMRLDFRPETDAATVRFYAAFGGTVNREAYLEVQAPSRDSPAATAHEVANAAIGSSAGTTVEITDATVADWADEAVTFTYRRNDGTHVTGRVLIARHEGRTVRFIISYPSEYGDGMGPRVARILTHWRWEHTDAPLTGQ